MPTFTENIELVKPDPSDQVDVTDLNENADKIDYEFSLVYESLDTVKGEAEKAKAVLSHTAPMQDASVEGRYMLFAEYTFPKTANFESADLTLLIRNRGVNAAAEDGILRVRLRYGRASAAFQYAQIYFTQNSGIDPARFILCCNNAAGTARLYLDASTAYAGYICKVLDMGTSASIVDFSSWALYNPTSGIAELPAEAEGWTSSTGAAVAAASE